MENSVEYLEKRERLAILAGEIERSVINGEKSIVSEEDRKMIRESLAVKDLNLGEIEGAANLGEQAADLVKVLGEKWMTDILPEIISNMLDLPGGNVYGKDGRISGDTEQEEDVQEFLSGYLYKKIQKDNFVFDPSIFGKDDYRRNLVYRLEATISVVNKLLWMVAPIDEAEGQRRQDTKGITKHFRERLLRGEERAGGVIPESTPRYGEEVCRHLPKGGMGVILRVLMAVRE